MKITAIISANTDTWKRYPHSEYWRTMHCGFIKVRESLPDQVELNVIYPESAYRDDKGTMKRALSGEPDYIITAFSRKGSFYQLRRYPNKIVAIDVPPNRKTLRKFRNQIIGYVGTEHVGLGEMACEELSRCGETLDCILVVMHDNAGHRLKLEGIRTVGKKYGVPVFYTYLRDGFPKIVLPEKTRGKHLGVIALGTKDVKAAQEEISPDELRALVGVDINESIADLIEKGQMVCTFVQQPYEMAKTAVDMILKANPEQPYREVFIDTIRADKDNVREILAKQKW